MERCEAEQRALAEKNAALEGRVEHLELLTDRLGEVAELLNDRLREVETTQMAAERGGAEQQRALAEKVDALEAQLKAGAGKLERLEGQVEGLTQQVIKVDVALREVETTQMAAVRGKAQQALGMNATLEGQIQGLERAIETAAERGEAQQRALAEKNAALEGQVQGLEQVIKNAAEAQAQKNEADVKRFCTSNMEVKAERLRHQRLMAEVEKLKAEVRDQRTAETQRAVERCEAEQRALAEKNAALEGQVQGLELAVDRLRAVETAKMAAEPRGAAQQRAPAEARLGNVPEKRRRVQKVHAREAPSAAAAAGVRERAAGDPPAAAVALLTARNETLQSKVEHAQLATRVAELEAELAAKRGGA